MPQPKRLKPFTFFGKVPSGVTTVDLTNLLVQRFDKAELGGVQDFGAGKFEVFIKTREAIQRFLKDPVLEVKGKRVSFEYRGTRTKLVRVFGYASEHQDVELVSALRPFGNVVAVSRESVPGFPTVTTGIRRIKMEMKAAVPNFLTVVDTEVMCEYDGVARVCRRCEGRGHMSATCEAPECSRCGEIGHTTCTAACPRCGGDHAVRKCTVRTFADIVGEDEEEAPEMWEEIVVAASEPHSSCTTGDSANVAVASPLPEEAVATQNLSEPDRAPVAKPIDTCPHVSSDVPADVAPAAEGERDTEAPTAAGQNDAAGERESAAATTKGEERQKKTHRNAAKRKRDREAKKTEQIASRGAKKTPSETSAPKAKKAAHFKKSYKLSDSESEGDHERDDRCEHCDNTECDCLIVTEHSIESTEFQMDSDKEVDSDSDVT